MQFPGLLNSKLPLVGTSIFAVMSQLANEYNAINLSQGFPDFEISPKLIDLVTTAMKKGYNQYAPMPGVMELREAIAEKVENLYGAKYCPESEITVTAGAAEAIFTAILSQVREGDEVIVFTPAYDSYIPAIELAGGIPKSIELKFPNYNINWEEVKKVVNQRTKMIIINTPNNPTGTVFTEEDINQLERLVNNTDIIILSDEVYEHIIFDGKPHLSMSRYPKLAERSFVIHSFGKTLHTTGWKIGYCCAPKELTREFRKIHQFIVFCVNTPLQYAIAEYIRNPEIYQDINNFYQEKRDYFISLVSKSKFKPLNCAGTYFILLSYKEISKEKETDFAVKLVKKYGVAAVPVSVFYSKPVDNHVLRFCFAKKKETLEKAAEKLCKI